MCWVIVKPIAQRNFKIWAIEVGTKISEGLGELHNDSTRPWSKRPNKFPCVKINFNI